MKAILSARLRSYRGARRPVLYAFLVLVSIGASATAQSDRPLVQRLDSIAGVGVLEKRSVGIVAAVVGGKDPRLVKFYRAYGKSDVESDVAMTVDTVIPIGSVTKQFTAAAILQLRDQGKLAISPRGAPANPVVWIEGWKFRGRGGSLLNGNLGGRGPSRPQVL